MGNQLFDSSLHFSRATAIDRDTDQIFPIIESPEAVAVPGDVESFVCEQAGSSFLEFETVNCKSLLWEKSEPACEKPMMAERLARRFALSSVRSSREPPRVLGEF